jgi:hypothetical protein
MATNYYVTTSTDGVERTPDGEIAWEVPDPEAALPAEPTFGRRLLVRDEAALLDVLSEVVYRAEVVEGGEEERPGVLVASSARLVSRTAWDPLSAAYFALDCAEHAVGDAGEVELPTGLTLAGAIADARAFLAASSGTDGDGVGRLARFSAARRLRREGRRIGDLALEMLETDLQEQLDATDDPAWTKTTATGDAVLAAVETLRHLAAPHYVGAREQNAEPEHAGEPVIEPTLIETPFGPWMIGAQHESPYLSSGALAREAALRAREAAGDRADEERRWQASRLGEVLES